MKWKKGNIWNYWENGMTIVIPTNIGWKKDGSNVMGKGLAKEAADNVEGEFNLPLFYGGCCRLAIPWIYLPEYDFILVPSKPLNLVNPHLSWRGPATIGTVKQSLQWLQKHVDVFKAPVMVPVIGTGYGKLHKTHIISLMTTLLRDDRFIGVEKEIEICQEKEIEICQEEHK